MQRDVACCCDTHREASGYQRPVQERYKLWSLFFFLCNLSREVSFEAHGQETTESLLLLTNLNNLCRCTGGSLSNLAEKLNLLLIKQTDEHMCVHQNGPININTAQTVMRSIRHTYSTSKFDRTYKHAAHSLKTT